jgi:hypothetical protein
VSYALIDNASLTSAQRLLGRIETRGTDSIDGDIAAFEHLVQALLFYQDVVCVDDYKAEHRLSREKEFSFIRFLSPSDFGLDDIDKLAGEEARRFKPEIRGGEFADEDFRKFFDQLRLNIICTWDISSSIYYLTMKMLGQPDTEDFKKYAEISASIFTELTDQINRGGGWNDDVILVDSRGRSIGKGYTIDGAKWGRTDTGGLTPGLEAFIAALNWLVRRTLFYSFVGRHLHADTFLHPIRSGFQIHYMQKTGAFGYDFTHALLQSFAERSENVLTSIISGPREFAVKMNLPLFLGWFVNEAGSVEKILPSVLSVRDATEFRDARHQIMQIRDAIDDEDITRANKEATKIGDKLDKTLEAIRKKFGLKSSGTGLSLSPVIKVFNSLAAFTGWPKLPEIKTRVPIPDFLQKALTQKGLVQVYRNIVSDLPAIWRLGDTRKRLAASVRMSEERVFAARVEDPKFRRAHSRWKSPM